MENQKINYILYLVTDKNLAGKKSLSKIVSEAIKGGVTIVQYREKSAIFSEMLKDAKILHKITQKAGIPLIINDRVDLALEIDAEGIHLGQKDMSPALARKKIGPKKIMGVTVNTYAQAIKAVSEGADYLGVGDIFGSTTKKDTGEPIGLEIIKRIRKIIKIPIIGIGGITKENAGDVITAGVDGIAVISAIIGKPNPEKESRDLIKIIKEAPTLGGQSKLWRPKKEVK